MELSSSSGVVAVELMSALSSQLSIGPGPFPTGEGSSTCKRVTVSYIPVRYISFVTRFPILVHLPNVLIRLVDL